MYYIDSVLVDGQQLLHNSSAKGQIAGAGALLY